MPDVEFRPATERQLKFIRAISREIGLGEDEVAAEVHRLYGCALGDINRRDAGYYIQRLRARRAPA